MLTREVTEYEITCKQFEDESKLIKDKRKHHGAVDKCNSFINPMCLPLLCRAIHVAQLGLTASWLTGLQTNMGNFRIFKIYYRLNF